MSARRALLGFTLSTVAACALGPVAWPAPAFGQVEVAPGACASVGDEEITSTAKKTTPALTKFPVVVHYMKREGAAPESQPDHEFPIAELKTLFREDGDFNRVWWKKHRKVMFVLVGVETCTYRGDQAPAADSDVMSKLGDVLNTKTMELANGSKKFTGLDLYLWPGIEGFGNIAGFARSVAVMKHPSVWLSRDCSQRGGHTCASTFGHEVGHFFGLCHICTADAVRNPETTPRTCGQTCPAAVRANTLLPACTDGDASRLMADQGGIDLQPCELSFAVGNAAKI